MGETTDQIASRIDQTREELKANLEELESRAKDVLDWREQFRRHPGPMFVAALFAGVVLSSILGRNLPFRPH
jgi:hypothetical protein